MAHPSKGRFPPREKRDRRAVPCKWQKCERDLLRDADICYAKLGVSHNDTWDINGNPTCGACLNVPSMGGDWNAERISGQRDWLYMVHNALRYDWPVPTKLWEKKIIPCLKEFVSMEDPHAGRTDDNEDWLESSFAFRRRQALAVRVLQEIYIAGKHGKRPSRGLTFPIGWGGRGGSAGRKGH